jgi:hypothetical protein
MSGKSSHIDLNFESLDMLVFLGTKSDGAIKAWWTHPKLTLPASVLYLLTFESIPQTVHVKSYQ